MNVSVAFQVGATNVDLLKVIVSGSVFERVEHPVNMYYYGISTSDICWTNQIPTGTVAVVDTVLQLNTIRSMQLLY